MEFAHLIDFYLATFHYQYMSFVYMGEERGMEVHSLYTMHLLY